MTLALGVAAGLAIGALLGLLGAGGSILAVPVLMHLFGQDPHTATTGSLLVVAVGAAVGAVSAHRHGTVLVARGVGFGIVAIGGSLLGAQLADALPAAGLAAGFAVLLVTVAATLTISNRASEPTADWAEPILTISPRPMCACPRVLKVAIIATAVGVVTGLFGVGAGFLVTPALVLALGLPAATAVGTSLVAIAVASSGALVGRLSLGFDIDWVPVLLLGGAAALTAPLAARWATRVPRTLLVRGFAALLVTTAVATAWRALA